MAETPFDIMEHGYNKENVHQNGRMDMASLVKQEVARYIQASMLGHAPKQ